MLRHCSRTHLLSTTLIPPHVSCCRNKQPYTHTHTHTPPLYYPHPSTCDRPFTELLPKQATLHTANTHTHLLSTTRIPPHVTALSPSCCRNKQPYTHANTHTHTHTRKHTRTHTPTPTHTHTHANTHTASNQSLLGMHLKKNPQLGEPGRQAGRKQGRDLWIWEKAGQQQPQ